MHGFECVTGDGGYGDGAYCYATRGDGILAYGEEECDDGNTSDNDG